MAKLARGNQAVVSSLLEQLDEAYDRQSWHGTNLRGSLRGLSSDQALWRPAPDRHNVWEFVIHAAYWKYAARRRLTGEKRGAFPRKGSNWFPSPSSPTEDGVARGRRSPRGIPPPAARGGGPPHRCRPASPGAGRQGDDRGASCAAWPPTTSTTRGRSSS